MRILVVEDDLSVATQIGTMLQQAGYVVDLAHNGEEGQFLGDTEPYDLVVLDIGLPDIDGLTILDRWRGSDLLMPVIIVSARNTWREKVSGLRKGADDYLAKPFEMEELLARVESLIRRSTGHPSPILECGPLKLDTAFNRITLDGTPVQLTALEFRMLSYLVHHKSKIVSKTELIEHIYDRSFDLDSNTIEVLVNRLRKKIGADFIRTHRGQGYQLEAPDDAG